MSIKRINLAKITDENDLYKIYDITEEEDEIMKSTLLNKYHNIKPNEKLKKIRLKKNKKEIDSDNEKVKISKKKINSKHKSKKKKYVVVKNI